MKNSNLFLWIIITIGMSFCAFAQSSESSLLSIEETVGLIHKRFKTGIFTEELIKLSLRANPAAREELYKILKDQTRKADWDQTIILFAYIGNADDVPQLESFLRQFTSKLNVDESRAVDTIFCALDGLIARDIKQAKSLYDEMLTQKYWSKYSFKYYPFYPSCGLRFEASMVYICLGKRVFAMESDYAQIVEKTINAIDDLGEREKIRKGFLRDEPPYVTEIRNGPWRLIKTIGATPSKESEERRDITPSKSVNFARNADDDISRMIAQALAAYARLSDAFVAQEYEKVAPWISKDGKPVIFRIDENSTSVIEKKRRDFGRAQNIPLEVAFTEEKKSAVVKMFNQECSPANRELTAGMVKELKAAGLPLGSAEVEIINVGKYTEIDRGGGRFGDITNKTTTMVWIPCPGSAKIGQKYITFDLSPRCQSMTREKELVILMYKIGDDWFWEPFGW